MHLRNLVGFGIYPSRRVVGVGIVCSAAVVKVSLSPDNLKTFLANPYERSPLLTIQMIGP